MRDPATLVKIAAVKDAVWEEAGRSGLAYLPIRRDEAGADFLGLLRFDAFASSGLHQHLDVAMSYMLSGGLTDRQGTVSAGTMGINFHGSTHDAVSYERSLMVSRLEGPALYLPELEHHLHVGARRQPICVESAEQAPDIAVCVQELRVDSTAFAGVGRKMVFDYSITPHDRRCVELHLLPGAQVPIHRMTARVDWFILSGDVEIAHGSRRDVAGTSTFVMMEPGAEVALRSHYGARILAWADGMPESLDSNPRHDLYGFQSLRSARRPAAPRQATAAPASVSRVDGA
jgi:hypothetical protein